MTPADIHPVPLFLLGIAVVAVILFTLGLCRAAADVREVEPDNGEYHD